MLPFLTTAFLSCLRRGLRCRAILECHPLRLRIPEAAKAAQLQAQLEAQTKGGVALPGRSQIAAVKQIQHLLVQSLRVGGFERRPLCTAVPLCLLIRRAVGQLFL